MFVFLIKSYVFRYKEIRILKLEVEYCCSFDIGGESDVNLDSYNKLMIMIMIRKKYLIC